MWTDWMLNRHIRENSLTRGLHLLHRLLQKKRMYQMIYVMWDTASIKLSKVILMDKLESFPIKLYLQHFVSVTGKISSYRQAQRDQTHN